MRALTPREQLIASITVGILMISGVVFYILNPLAAKEARLDEEIAKQTSILNKGKAIVRRAEGKQNPYEVLMAPFFPRQSDEEEMSVLLSQMENLASQMGLRVVDVKPRPGKASKDSKSFSISLSVEGTLVEVGRFLYAAQAAPYELNINGVRFDSRGPQQNTLDCKIDLSRWVILKK